MKEKKMEFHLMDGMRINSLFDQMIEQQQRKVLACARRINPRVTEEDLLQPNDYSELENHPHFRYEEGVLEGLRSALMALRAETHADKRKIHGFQTKT